MPKNNEKKPPQVADLVEGFSAMASMMQKHGEAIQGIMSVLGISDNGSQGASGVMPDDGGEGGETSEGQGGGYPYGFGKDQAKMDLQHLAFDPQASKLPELTETTRGQVQPTAAVEADNIYIDNMGKIAALQEEAMRLKIGAKTLEKNGDITAASRARADAGALMAKAEAIYEPFDTIFIRCRDRRMLSVQRRSRMEILEFNRVQQERERVEEGQEQGF